MDNFQRLHIPEQREKVRLRNHSGGLRNQLARDIPEVVSIAVKKLYKKYPTKHDAVIAHSGGRDVIEAVEKTLHCDLTVTSEVLASHGNMSSASLPVALERYIHTAPSNTKRIWLTAFGTGFSAYACELIKC